MLIFINIIYITYILIMSIWTIDYLKDIWENQGIMVVVLQHNGSSLGTGTRHIYHMGNYWSGGGHPGGSLTGYIYSRNFDFTSLLSGRHGSNSIWRLNNASQIGVLDGNIDNNTISQYGINPPQSTAILSQITFHQHPHQNNEISGLTFIQQPIIHFLDTDNNIMDVNYNVTMTIISGNGTIGGTTTISAVNGVATFTNLKIIGSGNQILKATYSTFTTQSNNINLQIPSINQLLILEQPYSNYINSTLNNITVNLKDSNNNNIYSQKSLTVTLIKNDGTVSSNLLGTTTITTNSNGTGIFNDLSVSSVENNYKLKITLDEQNVINSLSNKFNILDYPVSQISINTNIPTTNSRNEIFSQQPIIELKNTLNQIATQSTDTVTIIIKGINGVISGTTQLNAINGIANFTDLKITTVGTYTLEVSVLTLKKDLNTITINHLPVSKLFFQTEPSDGVINQNIPPVIIELHDTYNYKVDGNIDVTIIKKSGPGNFTDITYTAINGTLTANNILFDEIGIYQLNAEIQLSGVIIVKTSNQFQILADINTFPTQITYNIQPSNTVSSQNINDIKLNLLDAGGNILTGFNGNISIDINQQGTILYGQKTKNAQNGIVIFDDLNIKKNGTFNLNAFITSKTDVNSLSNNFNITLGSPNSIVILRQPSSSVKSMYDLEVLPILQILDIGDNLITTYNDLIDIEINTSPVGASISGVTYINASNGQVDFTGKIIKLDKTGIYTLKISLNQNNNISVITNNITVTPGDIAKLKFIMIPSLTSNTSVFLENQPILRVYDSHNNYVNNYNGNISLTFTSTSDGKFLNNTGDISMVSNNGEADFNNNKIGFTKTATYNLKGFTIVNDVTINSDNTHDIIVSPGELAEIEISKMPSNGYSMVQLFTKPIFLLKDAGGNIVNDDYVLTLSVYDGPSGHNFTGDISMVSNNGISDFSGNSFYFDKVGTYKIYANGGSGINSLYANINIEPSNVFTLDFHQQPSNTVMSAQALSTQPIIHLYDKGGNLAITSNNLLTLNIKTGPNFSSLHAPMINESFLNQNIILTTDNKLKINNNVYDNIVWQNVPTAPGQEEKFILTSIQPYINGIVEISGNNNKYHFVNGDINYIQKYANNGVLDFTNNNLYLDKIGDYTLNVTISGNTNGGLTETLYNDVLKFILDNNGFKIINTFIDLSTLNTESNIISVSSGLPNYLLVHKQPFGNGNNEVIAGEAFYQQPIIYVYDICGNLSSHANNNLSLSLLNSDDSLFFGNKTLTSTNGIFTYTNLLINILGHYILKAKYDDLVVNTNPINVKSNVPAYIKFKVQPSGGEINIPLTIQPVIQFYDIYNNLSTKNSTTISININQGPNNALLIGQNNILSDINKGEAVFNDIAFNLPGEYTLNAYTSNFSILSDSIVMSNISLNTLIFETQPIDGYTDIYFTHFPKIKLLDSGGNVLINSQNVSLSIVHIDNSIGELLGTTNMNANNGIAEFSQSLSISLSGRYRLKATSGSKTVESNIITINNPSLNALSYVSKPDTVYENKVIDPIISINLLTSFGSFYNHNTDISLIIVPSPTSGTLNKTTNNGNIVFDDLTFNNANDYNINALAYPHDVSFTQISNDISLSFILTVENLPPSNITFLVEPSGNIEKNTELTTQPVLEVKNADDNLIDHTKTVELSIYSQDHNGILIGTTSITSNNGLYTYNNIKLSQPGNYTLKAQIDDISVISQEITILPKSIHTLSVINLPSQDYINKPLNYDISLQIRDNDGDLILKNYDFTIDVSGSGTIFGTKQFTLTNGEINLKDFNIVFSEIGVKNLVFTTGTDKYYSQNINMLMRDIKEIEILVEPDVDFVDKQFTIYPSLRIIDVSDNSIPSYNKDISFKLYDIDNNNYTYDIYSNEVPSFNFGHYTFNNLKITKNGNYKVIFSSEYNGITYDTSSNVLNLQNYSDYIHNIRDIKAKQNIYDVIIVGSGPSASMTAYELSKNNTIGRILMIEKGIMTPSAYNINYNNINSWNVAMNDPNTKYTIDTSNNSIMLGQGLGGGTLHFGLQYIDQTNLTKMTNQILEDEIEYVNQVTQTVRYDYDNDNGLMSWLNLKNTLELNNLDVYNNKIYSRDKTVRFTSASLIPNKNNVITDHSNIDILYGTEVDKLVYVDTSNIRGIKTNLGDYYYSNRVVLCAGAIQTPAILQRSGIGNTTHLTNLGINTVKNLPVGEEIYDHGGFSVYYRTNDNFSSNIIGHLQTRDSSLNWQIYYSYVSSLPNTIISTIAQSSDLTGLGYVKINNSNVSSPIFNSSSDLLTNDLIGQINSLNFYIEPLNSNLMENNSETIINSYIDNKPSIVELSNIKKYWTNIGGIKNINVLPNTDIYNTNTWFYINVDNKEGWFKNEKINTPDISINYFSDTDTKYSDYLLDAFNKNHNALKTNYNLLYIPSNIINTQYIQDQTRSIYHYHGTCQFNKVVDYNHKVFGFNNLYIGDLSVINSPLPGSSSVPALALGFRVSKSIINGRSEELNNGNVVKITITNYQITNFGGSLLQENIHVNLLDVSDNIVNTANTSVQLSLDNTSEEIFGTLTKNAVNGVVIFDDIKINKVGTYKIKATINEPYYLEIKTNDIIITQGQFAKIGFSQQPEGNKEGSAFKNGPILSVQDLGGNNIVDINQGSVKITELLKLTGSTITSTISGDLTRNIINGKADFTDASLNINTFGTYRILTELTHPIVTSNALSNTFSISAKHVGTTLGDPYISPLHGPTYKLKDGDYNYRYIDNNEQLNRFYINFSTKMLDENKTKQVNEYILSMMSKKTGINNINDTYNYIKNKNLEIISDYCFTNQIYINNMGSIFHFNIENFNFITPFDSKYTIHKIENEEIFTDIQSYQKIKSIAALRITTYNESYGYIQLYLYKYKNPQIRNSFKLVTQKSINESSTRGCILYKQEHMNIIINNIFSDQIICKPLRNYIENKNNEIFYTYNNNIGINGINENINY